MKSPPLCYTTYYDKVTGVGQAWHHGTFAPRVGLVWSSFSSRTSLLDIRHCGFLEGRDKYTPPLPPPRKRDLEGFHKTSEDSPPTSSQATGCPSHRSWLQVLRGVNRDGVNGGIRTTTSKWLLRFVLSRSQTFHACSSWASLAALPRSCPPATPYARPCSPTSLRVPRVAKSPTPLPCHHHLGVSCHDRLDASFHSQTPDLVLHSHVHYHAPC